MARKKTTDAGSPSSAVDPQSAGRRPRGQPKPAAQPERRPRRARSKGAASAAVAPSGAAVEVEAVTRDFEAAKEVLEALRRQTHAAALQLAALRHQAEALNQEMERTRRDVLREAEQLAEVRELSGSLRAALHEARQDMASLSRQVAEAGSALASQLRGPVEQIEREYAEACGRLEQLRLDADEAARTATALRSRSLEAAAEIAEAAAEVRQTLQEAAEAAVEYANVGAILGAEGVSAEPGPPSAEAGPMQLGVTVAPDSGTVLEVAPDSPAARAGVLRGDIITSANGEPVRNGPGLREIVSRLGAGREVVLGLQRGGRSEEVRAPMLEAAEPPV